MFLVKAEEFPQPVSRWIFLEGIERRILFKVGGGETKGFASLSNACLFGSVMEFNGSYSHITLDIIIAQAFLPHC